MSTIDQLRDAARQCRRVVLRIRVPGPAGGQALVREVEPYALRNGRLLAYSYFSSEYRTVPVRCIEAVEPRPETFVPRRPVEL